MLNLHVLDLGTCERTGMGRWEVKREGSGVVDGMIGGVNELIVDCSWVRKGSRCN